MMEKTISLDSPRELSDLYLGKISLLEKVESTLSVDLVARDNWIKIHGIHESINRAEIFFELLILSKKQGLKIRKHEFLDILNAVNQGKEKDYFDLLDPPLKLKIRRKTVVPKNISQKHYLNALLKDDVVFGIGPAGTGKTYLAIAVALQSLLNGEVDRIVVTRPAVEAGEALGFLPGDLEEKILPYLRPLYDAMEDMVGKEDTNKMMERGLIEVAPLAYMRGRTLSKAFVILDEAQNSTSEQMMMFLTRLGSDSKMIITGDITQVDLPRSKKSGLKMASKVLEAVDRIKIFYFKENDVVRHPLVRKIIEAYNAYEFSGKQDEG
jgi:phosphate starvation-inducible PhoH-like protein